MIDILLSDPFYKYHKTTKIPALIGPNLSLLKNTNKPPRGIPAPPKPPKPPKKPVHIFPSVLKKLDEKRKKSEKHVKKKDLPKPKKKRNFRSLGLEYLVMDFINEMASWSTVITILAFTLVG